jgi:hypothetical protein
MAAVWVLLGLVVLRVVAVATFAYLLIPRSATCPGCGEPTVRLRAEGLARLLPGLDRRWCTACGWSWYRRRLTTASADQGSKAQQAPSPVEG